MTTEEVKALWEDFRDRFDRMEISQEQKELLDRRRARVHTGQAQFLDWDLARVPYAAFRKRAVYAPSTPFSKGVSSRSASSFTSVCVNRNSRMSCWFSSGSRLQVL